MPDVLASTATTDSIAINGVVTGSIEVREDHDWYRIDLTAGQKITISMAGIGLDGLVDPYLNLRNSSGVIIAHNDDSGGGRNAKIVFTVTQSGTYFVDAGAWDSSSETPWTPGAEAGYTGTGNYTLSVQPYTPPPVYSYDQIANQLVNGYWSSNGGETARHFNVSQGGSITVDYSGLTAAERTLAINALGEWSDIIGVNFTSVTGGAQITFHNTEDPADPGPQAYTEDHISGGVYSSADIYISTSWVKDYGAGLNTYSFQTYLHEIGHALGLGHAGNYNGTADYATDALYANDSWATSIMSYFDVRNDNTYFSSQGFNFNLALTPMNGDVVALQQMYGLSTTTRAGNTTYGFNSNAGRDVYNASIMSDVAYTIYDSGGVDTLDYSGFTQNQSINLNPETFSNIGPNVGNVVIARGVVIENATGGSGSDTITGNAVANKLVGNAGTDSLLGGAGDDILVGGSGIDQLTGGTGSDTFSDTKAGLNGDTLTDFGAGDRIVLTDATMTGFTFSLSGNTLTYTGGSLKFGAAFGGTLVASAAASGGVQLALALPRDAANDFNGDGRSDILWRYSNGTMSEWLGQSSGGLLWNSAAGFQVGTDWSIKGFGDFNGDLRDDILWRQDGTGTVMLWTAQSNGGFAWNVNYNLAATTQLAGIGDFDGDGRDDILWRDSSGTLSEWLGQPNGGFQWNAAAAFNVSNDWKVVGTGDFNKDGNSDLLWRQDGSGTVMEWLGDDQGSFAWNVNFSLATSYHLVGTGDFNGDGVSDIMWRNSDGRLSEWLGQGNGGFQWNPNASFAVSNDWQSAGIGDYNGDGIDDIMWQTNSGHIYQWLGKVTGSTSTFVWNQAVQYDVSADLHVQPVPDHFL